jgi:phosphatidylinositol alpha-1,6-mannosyltransferase
MTPPDIQVAAQFLTAGSGGIARCARLTIMALAPQARVRGLAVEDAGSTLVGNLKTRAFRGNRSAFVAANMVGALTSDWVIYDFAGTARAHGLLGLAGRPYALWAHGWEVWPGNLRPDYARAIRGAKAVFVNSGHTGDRLAESLPGLKTIHVCQLGTETDLSPSGVAAPARDAGGEKIVLFVGRNDEMFAKGQDVLIAAWPKVVAQAPDATLCFVGGGERLDRLRELAAASPAASSIKVLGQLTDAEVEALRSRARLFAMLSNVEGFGLVFAEAMSQGVPVLTSNEDASTEVNLHGETGFAVSRDDLDEVAATILSVLKDDRLFEQLSRQAYERWRGAFCFSAFRDRFLTAAAAAGLVRAPLVNGHAVV